MLLVFHLFLLFVASCHSVPIPGRIVDTGLTVLQRENGTVNPTKEVEEEEAQLLNIDCSEEGVGVVFASTISNCSSSFFVCTSMSVRYKRFPIKFKCPEQRFFKQRTQTCEPIDDVPGCTGKEELLPQIELTGTGLVIASGLDMARGAMCFQSCMQQIYNVQVCTHTCQIG